LGHGPQKAHPCTGHGDDHLGSLLTSCHQAAIAFAESDLGLPADVLENFGLFFQAQWQLATDFRRIAIRPSALNEGPTGMGRAGLSARTLAALLPRGLRRGHQPQALPEVSGVLEAREVSEFGHPGDRPGALHATPGLEGCDHRV
jgi:hypothetical protein